MPRTAALIVSLSSLCLALACGESHGRGDAGSEASLPDAGTGAGTDAGREADAGTDASTDAGTDASVSRWPDAGPPPAPAQRE